MSLYRYHMIPLFDLPFPDGLTTVTDIDKKIFADIYPIGEISDDLRNILYNVQNNTIHRRIVIKEFDGTYDFDVSNWVLDFGTVQRSVDYDTGKMSVSSHTFRLQETSDKLWILRSNYGESYWQGLEYDLDIGYRKSDGDIEWINIYTGNIVNKTEDRINGVVQVQSNCIFKELHDKKLLQPINANTVFTCSTEDTRAIQPIIATGTHKLITNGSRKELKKRDDPFSAVVAVPNINAGYPINDSGTTYNAYKCWYVPLRHSAILSSGGTSYYTSGALKIYYWDYNNNVWTQIDTGDISTTSGAGPVMVGYRNSYGTPTGFYITIESETLTNTGITWGTSDYLDTSDSEFDPAIAIEVEGRFWTYNTGHNPVSEIYGLLTESTLLNWDKERLDYTSYVISSIYGGSWGNAWDFFDSESGDINIRYENSNTTAMEIINEICLVCNMSFFIDRKDSSGVDRRVRLTVNNPINIQIYPLKQNEITWSTKDKLSAYILNTNTDDLENIVKTVNFDTSISLRDMFDITINTDTSIDGFDREMSLGKTRNPPVYFYDSGTLADATGQRFLNLRKVAAENIQVNFGKAGFEIELGEIVTLHEKNSDETLDCIVHKTNFNTQNGDKVAELKRHPYRFGPDESDKDKLWWFWGDDTEEYSYWSESGDVPPNGGGPNGETYHFF